jgi:hypothetical protein
MIRTACSQMRSTERFTCHDTTRPIRSPRLNGLVFVYAAALLVLPVFALSLVGGYA